MRAFCRESILHVLIGVLSENTHNQGVESCAMNSAVWNYWNRIYRTLMENNSPFVVKVNDDPLNYLINKSLSEEGSLARRAVGLVNCEFARRAGDVDDNLLETLQRVIEKRRSKTCEEAKLMVTPNLRLAFASPQKLRNHVWDIEKEKGCLICNSDVQFVIAMLLRSTIKHKKMI